MYIYVSKYKNDKINGEQKNKTKQPVGVECSGSLL
jgi:hypothetical protein